VGARGVACCLQKFAASHARAVPGAMTDQDDLPPPAERRPSPRARVLLSGIVTYDAGVYSFECAFRSLSATGARIVAGSPTQFPPEFFLINIRDRVAHDCKLIWSNGREAGVTFKATISLPAITDPGLAYLKKLWLTKAK
jgi:hypothetical protein